MRIGFRRSPHGKHVAVRVKKMSTIILLAQASLGHILRLPHFVLKMPPQNFIQGLLIAKILSVTSLHFDSVHFSDPGLIAALTLLISLALLTLWLVYFDQVAIRRMGFIYAERLFECLPFLPS